MQFPKYNAVEGIWTVTFPKQEYYSVLQMGYLLHMSTPQIYSLINRGKLRAVSVIEDGVSLIRIEHDEMLRFIEVCRKRREKREVKPYIPLTLQGLDQEARAALQERVREVKAKQDKEDEEFAKAISQS